MVLYEDLVQYGLSQHCGKNFDFYLVDFSLVHPNASLLVKYKCRDFRDNLIRNLVDDTPSRENERRQPCKWTIEFIWGEIRDDVINFNEYCKSVSAEHRIMFLCFDNHTPSFYQDLLTMRYPNSVFFEFDSALPDRSYDAIFNCIRECQHNEVVRKKPRTPDYFYPLRLHTNSISSGLVFNYYYSYLNRQVGSTNNIVLTFVFNRNISQDVFPLNIRVVLDTWIESIYGERCPSTMPEESLLSLLSNTLIFGFDTTKYKIDNDKQTSVTYHILGVNDFGPNVEKVYIWQEKFDIEALISIQLQDDIRQWNENYRPCLIDYSLNEQPLAVFEKETPSTNGYSQQCHIFSIENAPVISDRQRGISTMKKTTKDCYDAYVTYLRKENTDEDKRNVEIRLVPVYYILAPTSCNFGSPNTNTTCQLDEMNSLGTIIDPDNPNRIRLASMNGEVLRSRPMIRYNRYLRRTFYYVDELDENNKTIRYLFCGEYPYILNILDQLERNGQINSAQKRDEYLRFCNMLNRIIVIDNLSESIKLIQYNDEEQKDINQLNEDDSCESANYADNKPLWTQIKDYTDQWYDRSDAYTLEISISSMIFPCEPNHRVGLFFANRSNNDQLIEILIEDLKEKLENHNYVVNTIECDLDLIDESEQIIFIYTGLMTDQDNRQMMQTIGRKITKYGVLRDVFILINDAIQYIPCHIIKSVPYLTFDLRKRPTKLTDDEIRQVINYLNNMNVLSKTYTDMFDELNDSVEETPLQCTGVGVGCAAAFYFNYAKLLTSLPNHQLRVQHIHQQLVKENLIDSQQRNAIFISKWVFVIPWTIESSADLLTYGLSLNEIEQQTIGLKLARWESTDKNFTNPNITITLGGIFQRSYSPLIVYKLTNLTQKKTFYFPMEIPAALHGLQNQYQNILSHFNFGKFDPIEQAMTFRKKVEEYKANDSNSSWHKDILLVPLDRHSAIFENKSITPFEQAEILLQTLWQQLSSSENESSC